jgi:hypothetical protein
MVASTERVFTQELERRGDTRLAERGKCHDGAEAFVAVAILEHAAQPRQGYPNFGYGFKFTVAASRRRKPGAYRPLRAARPDEFYNPALRDGPSW